MKKHDIPVNDLYTLVLPELTKYLKRPDDVHFNAEGSKVLGRQVADAVLEQLKAPEAEGVKGR
jgi:lysophospholipase L1-like esterase